MDLLSSLVPTDAFPQGWFPLLFVIALVLTAILAYRLDRFGRLLAALPRRAVVRSKRVLTDNETEFLGRLQRALPDYEIWPQMSMGALMEPSVPRSHPDYWAIRSQFDRKICDYVIARKGSAHGTGVLAIIELDDRTHDPRKDAVRDAMLKSAGIRTIRYESRAKPSEATIREQIVALT